MAIAALDIERRSMSHARDPEQLDELPSGLVFPDQVLVSRNHRLMVGCPLSDFFKPVHSVFLNTFCSVVSWSRQAVAYLGYRGARESITSSAAHRRSVDAVSLNPRIASHFINFVEI